MANAIDREPSTVAMPMSTETRVPSLRTYSFLYGVATPHARSSATPRFVASCHSGAVRSRQRRFPATSSTRV